MVFKLSKYEFKKLEIKRQGEIDRIMKAAVLTKNPIDYFNLYIREVNEEVAMDKFR